MARTSLHSVPSGSRCAALTRASGAQDSGQGHYNPAPNRCRRDRTTRYPRDGESTAADEVPARRPGQPGRDTRPPADHVSRGLVVFWPQVSCRDCICDLVRIIAGPGETASVRIVGTNGQDRVTLSENSEADAGFGVRSSAGVVMMRLGTVSQSTEI